jgi:hypothetical protein
MSQFEVDFSFEDFNIITVVSAKDEFEAEVIATEKLANSGIDTKKFLLYETTVNPKN